MADQATEAASSPAEVQDPFQGQSVSMDEFTKYRSDGELPTRFKPESESASDDTQEETEEAEAEPEETQEDDAQEKPEEGGLEAKKRIKQLLAKQKELEAQLAAKQDVKPDSSSAQPQAQHTRPKPTADDKNQDGTLKFSTYEDFVEELADWKAEQRMATAKREQQQSEAQSALKTKLDEARTRYDDADEVIFPAAQAIRDASMPLVVKDVFDKSEYFIDLCYVVGSDPDELKKFIRLAQTDPRAAIGKVFEYERGIREELSQSPERNDKGQFVPEKKQTSAPRPPSPVGGSSSRAFDVSDESLSADEWARKRTEAIAKKRS